jgi:hypothetical protein
MTKGIKNVGMVMMQCTILPSMSPAVIVVMAGGLGSIVAVQEGTYGIVVLQEGGRYQPLCIGSGRNRWECLMSVRRYCKHKNHKMSSESN